MIIINYRKYKIINHLVSVNDEYVTIKYFSTMLSCSIRTIRNELKLIDDWLLDHVDKTLDRKESLGIKLQVNHHEKTIILEKLWHLTFYEYEFNRKERVELISFILLNTQDKITILELQDLFLLSRGTILKDLKRVEEFFNEYSVQLNRVPGQGLYILGDEFLFRKSFASLYKTMNLDLLRMLVTASKDQKQMNQSSLYDYKHFTNYSIYKTHNIQRIVDPIMKKHNVYPSDEGLNTLYLHISMVLIRVKSRFKIQAADYIEDLEAMYHKKEFEIAFFITRAIERQYKIQLPIEETTYIALHILGNQNEPRNDFDHSVNKDGQLQAQIKKITQTIERKAKITFRNKDKLNKGLLIHIKPAIYRAKYSMSIDNPLLSEIKKEYQNIFTIVKSSMRILEDEWQVNFADEEIAYVTMHYVGNLYHQDKKYDENSKVSVIIVCSTGLGTAVLLKNRIKYFFTNIEIVDVVSKRKFLHMDKTNINLVISTINLNVSNLPYIKVSPLLNSRDVEKLSDFLEVKEQPTPSAWILYEKTWPIIQRNAEVLDSSSLTTQLIKAFEEILNAYKIEIPNNNRVLSNSIDEKSILVKNQVNSWQEAIMLAASLLDELKIDNSAYGKEIISILREQGPYMSISPGIVLAHASPQKIDEYKASLLVLKNPIKFNHEKNDPIQIIFVFVASKEFQNQNFIRSIFEFLMQDTNVKKLKQAQDSKELLKVIKAY